MIRLRSDLPGDRLRALWMGDDRSQSTLFPERLDDYVGDDNPVRAIDVFVDELDLGELGFGVSSHGRRDGRPTFRIRVGAIGKGPAVRPSGRLRRTQDRAGR